MDKRTVVRELIIQELKKKKRKKEKKRNTIKKPGSGIWFSSAY
jgi:hypothetical protein